MRRESQELERRRIFEALQKYAGKRLEPRDLELKGNDSDYETDEAGWLSVG